MSRKSKIVTTVATVASFVGGWVCLAFVLSMFGNVNLNPFWERGIGDFMHHRNGKGKMPDAIVYVYDKGNAIQMMKRTSGDGSRFADYFTFAYTNLYWCKAHGEFHDDLKLCSIRMSPETVEKLCPGVLYEVVATTNFIPIPAMDYKFVGFDDDYIAFITNNILSEKAVKRFDTPKMRATIRAELE